MPTGAQMAVGDSSVGEFGALGLALLASAVLIALIGAWVELRVRRPLRRLSRAVGRAEAGDFLVRADQSSEGEIGKLSQSFNRLLKRITAMQAEEIDTHRDLAAANEQLKLKQAFEAANAQLENRLNELSLLYEVARSFTSTLELPELLGRISALVAERLEIPQFSIMLVNPEGKLEVKIAYPPAQGTEGVTFRIDEGACGKAAQTRAAVYIPDVSIDRSTFVARSGGPERGALLCVPMIHHEEVLGVLNFQRPENDSFSS
ncbi:MAG TPA: GAF domain-containing protein, partial [Myxococcaceae bacterium]|nr:GAF domain-containing protein [Myxococcaceae bacterium]